MITSTPCGVLRSAALDSMVEARNGSGMAAVDDLENADALGPYEVLDPADVREAFDLAHSRLDALDHLRDLLAAHTA